MKGSILPGKSFHSCAHLNPAKGIIVLFALFIILLSACSSRPGHTHISLQSIESYENDLRDENWEKRCLAVQALSQHLDGPYGQRIEQSILSVSNDEHDEVKIAVIKAFSRHPSPLFRERLLTITHDRSDNVRWYALTCLGEYGDPEAAPVFINGLMSEDWIIRESSIIGILKIRDLSVVNDLVPYIVRSLEDPNVAVRIATLENLTIRDPRLYRSIASIVSENRTKGPSLLVPALRALEGYILDDETREEIIPLLTHMNSDIRIAALHVIQEDQNLREKR